LHCLCDLPDLQLKIAEREFVVGSQDQVLPLKAAEALAFDLDRITSGLQRREVECACVVGLR
jgi:hypothetical protein